MEGDGEKGTYWKGGQRGSAWRGSKGEGTQGDRTEGGPRVWRCRVSGNRPADAPRIVRSSVNHVTREIANHKVWRAHARIPGGRSCRWSQVFAPPLNVPRLRLRPTRMGSI